MKIVCMVEKTLIQDDSQQEVPSSLKRKEDYQDVYHTARISIRKAVLLNERDTENGKGRAKNQNGYHYTFHRSDTMVLLHQCIFFCCFFPRHHIISQYTCYTYVQYATITQKTNTFSSGNTCVN